MKRKEPIFLPSNPLLTSLVLASGRPPCCSRPGQSPRADGPMLALLATGYKHNVKMKEGRPDTINVSSKRSFSLLHYVPDSKISGPL